jgi:hypothetical protein
MLGKLVDDLAATTWCPLLVRAVRMLPVVDNCGYAALRNGVRGDKVPSLHEPSRF